MRVRIRWFNNVKEYKGTVGKEVDDDTYEVSWNDNSNSKDIMTRDDIQECMNDRALPMDLVGVTFTKNFHVGNPTMCTATIVRQTSEETRQVASSL